MPMRSRFGRAQVLSRRRVYIPTTQKIPTTDFHYSKGFDSNTGNDELAPDTWRYISDAREIQIGKWMTRKGCDFFSVPIGEAINAQQTSTVGASDYTFSGTTRFAYKFTATSSARVTQLTAKLKNPSTATGTVVLSLCSDASGVPGTELFRTTIPNNQITSSYQTLGARSITCPDIISGVTYWVVGFVQDGGAGGYMVSTTSIATTGKTSSNSGQTWSASAFDFNIGVYTSTPTPVKGHIRIKRPNGNTVSFMAHDTNLYSINELNGTTTLVDNNIGSTSTFVRFAFVNDCLYYVDGTQKPRKYDFSTVSSVVNAPDNASAITVHKGFIFYQSANDVNKTFYTNFGLYDTFTSTDFLYVDSPKTGDPQKAYARLNGNLYIITRNNKYVLYGAENATFRLDNAVGQKGTYTQESIAYDESYIYLASDDGIFKFNGSQESNMTDAVQDWWATLPNKANTVLELQNNRLYIYYTAIGSAINNRCRVYNTLYDIWESDDLGTYICRSYSRLDNDNYMLVGSNRVGMVMQNELPSNDYNNMGEPLTYELRTRYEHYDHPAQYKRAPVYRPHFDTVTGAYGLQVGYATDYSDSPGYSSVGLQATGALFNSGVTFDSGVRFGIAGQTNPTDNAPQIPGEWRRLQIRYKHYGAREPVAYDGHILDIEVQKIT